MNERERTSDGYTYNKQNKTFEYQHRHRPSAQTVHAQRPPQTQKRKKKIRFKPNKDGIMALIALLLIVAVVITLLVLTIKAIAGAVSGNNEDTSTAQSTTESTSEAPIIPVVTWHDDYTNIFVSNSDIEVGSLILVNFENDYALADSSSLKLRVLADTTGHNTYFVLKNRSVKVRQDVRNALREMIFALVDNNLDTLGKDSSSDRVLISSGHRTIADQTKLYEDESNDEDLIALPGYSEHHTGYAVDLKIWTSDGKTIDMRENEQEWLAAHCAEYGFVVRYDGSKYEITGILDETWHYRYVGVPHATYMMENGLCLEEYLELLRTNYAYPNEPLAFTAGEDDYLVYYVEASADSTTLVSVPPESVGTYEISGDNMNGFIVTVKKAK